MVILDPLVREKIDSYLGRCLRIADYLTDNPETGGNEEKAAACITAFLRGEGYRVDAPCALVPHSFLAVPERRVDDTGPRVVLMCEYDALPGIGHACGHSLSCAASLLAGLALNDAYPELPLRVDMMGTPGEENISCKVALAERGAFDGYAFAAMAHMSGEGNIASFNTLGISAFSMTFRGRSSHASAAPEQGLNALNAARLCMDAMDMWRQHLPRGCQIHCVVKEGGTFPGIVPDKAVLEYWFRAESMRDLYALEEKARCCAEGAALCTGTSVTMENLGSSNAPLFCTSLSEELIGNIFTAMELPFHYGGKPQGSTDVGNVNLLIPTIHPLVHIAGEKTVLLHNQEFTDILKTEQAYQGVRNGAMLLAHYILYLAWHPDVREQIAREHTAMVARHRYT